MENRRRNREERMERAERRMRRSRKRREKRGSRVVLSCFLAILGLVILGGGVCLGSSLINKSQDKKAESEKLEMGREVAAESIPDGPVRRQTKAGTLSMETDPSLEPGERAKQLMAMMTLEEKVLQLFIITPEALTGVSQVTAAGESTKAAIGEYPVGGLVYFKENLQMPEQTKEMLGNIKKYSLDRIGVPVFTSVDEEGGSVSRVMQNPEFGIEQIPDMRIIGDSKDTSKAYDTGAFIGGYLSELGFNLDYAPVADVLTNPGNTVVARRSFGTDGSLTAQFVCEEVKGMQEKGVIASLKHFPGHGGTEGDTHDGYAYTSRTLEQLMKDEFVPFKAGIDLGVDFIMVAHIAAPNVTGDKTPASLSKKMVSEILRDQLGYQNIIITDAMNMGAITQEYESGEAAVKALEAGVDMILMPVDFKSAYQDVLEAVGSGVLTEERINQSVYRILKVKFEKLM